MPRIVAYYKAIGLIPESTTPKATAWPEKGMTYPKTKYSFDMCGIRAIMVEQYCASKMYGSDGTKINDVYQIKNYVTMLRMYVYAILECDKNKIGLGDLGNFYK